MTLFWGIVAALILLAILMIVVPVFFWKRRELRSGTGQLASDTEDLGSDREAENLKIFAQNIAELDRQNANGLISDEDYEQLKLETQRNLLVDIPEHSGAPDAPERVPSVRGTTIVASLLALIISVASITLYSEWGSADRVATLLEQRESGQIVDGKRAASGQRDFGKLADQLAEKLKDSPDDITGWLLLAKTRMSLKQPEKAAAIYLRLIDKATTDKNRAMVLGLYAQAEFFIAGERVTPAVLASIEKALQADPNEITALGLQGVVHFSNQQFTQAIASWERAAATTSNEVNRATLLRGIDQARQRLGQPAGASAVSGRESMAKADFGSVFVNLSIKPELLKSLNPDLWVYLFAKAVNGPRAPLAANRFKLSQLPLQVVLDDSSAMDPSLKISSFPQIEVVARVSMSGQPMASNGDLQGSTQLTRKGSSQTGIRLVIDSVIQ